MNDANKTKPTNEIPVSGIPFFCPTRNRYIILQADDRRLLTDWRTRDRYTGPA